MVRTILNRFPVRYPRHYLMHKVQNTNNTVGKDKWYKWIRLLLTYTHNLFLLELYFTFTECANTVSNFCKSFYLLSIMSICCRLFFIEWYNCTEQKIGLAKIIKPFASSQQNYWFKKTSLIVKVCMDKNKHS